MQAESYGWDFDLAWGGSFFLDILCLDKGIAHKGQTKVLHSLEWVLSPVS